ncbi:uncharacterized protein [Choristoneura fumiferana]|uniref:uncharacterized protein n=1 Tax=Choristoneura fumiferana TaxID=7141 RepID=UPI003D1557D3
MDSDTAGSPSTIAKKMKCSFKKVLPQEGTSSAGESLSAQALSPTYSGEGKNCSVDESPLVGENQTTTMARNMDTDLVYDDDVQNAEEVFCPRTPLARSPVRDLRVFVRRNSDGSAAEISGSVPKDRNESRGGNLAQPPEKSAFPHFKALPEPTTTSLFKLPLSREERYNLRNAGYESASSVDSVVALKNSSKIKGKRRPTAEQHDSPEKAQVDLTTAKRKKSAPRSKNANAITQDPVKARAVRSRKTTSVSMSDSDNLSPTRDPEEKSVYYLNKQVLDAIAVINSVAINSGHLKGTFVRKLNDASASITEAVTVLHKRSITEETAKLQIQNLHLRGELSELRKELTVLKADLHKSRDEPVSQKQQQHQPQQLNAEELTRAIMSEVGTMMCAKFAALEERLTLATSSKKKSDHVAGNNNVDHPATEKPSGDCNQTQGTPSHAPKSISSSAPKGKAKDKERKNNVENNTIVGKGKNKRKKSSMAAAEAAAQHEPQSNPRLPKATDEGWKVVTRKKRNEKKKAAAIPIRIPRSAAIVISLQPGAEASYDQIMKDTRSKIDLSNLDIPPVRFRVAATGARILTLPPTVSGEKMNSLAEAIRAVNNPEIVRVHRPTKCEELRVSGLDDSVSPTEVIAAIARTGGCLTDAIKAGEIKKDFSGSGFIWLRCPSEAAKKVIASGRLLVGWVSAQVKLLEPRPLRCYRCLLTGHVRVQCTSEVDRSDFCYRCSKPNHKAAQCSAKAHCAVCALAVQATTAESGSIEDGPRWALKQIDRELLSEAATVQAWLPAPGEDMEVEQEAEWFREAMSHRTSSAIHGNTIDNRRRSGDTSRNGSRDENSYVENEGTEYGSRTRWNPGARVVLGPRSARARLRALFTSCLREGQFPKRWKIGRLVLLQKEGRPADSPSAYRPIVLLDEVGKLFERIIASRLVKHMTDEGPDLADCQYGFRCGRSTVDAILRVKSLAEEAVSQGEVLLAVSLDIVNAFNTLPWETIHEALGFHRAPPYLCRIVRAYLSERVSRGYRTISGEAACVLAGSLPWDLDAKALAAVYRWREEARSRDHWPAPREVDAKRKELFQAAVDTWRTRLEHPTAGIRTVEAIRPVLRDWLEREHGALTFRLTQVLSGHGCFGRYLYKIARRANSSVP